MKQEFKKNPHLFKGKTDFRQRNNSLNKDEFY